MNIRQHISTGIPPGVDALYAKLFLLIDDALCAFQSEKDMHTMAEDKITLKLSLHLNDWSHRTSDLFSFEFVNQDWPADIGIHLCYDYHTNEERFCWIEAKRLPTPSSPERDKREYVFVDHMQFKLNGGIERFKLNKHGEGQPFAIMFGYIQSGTFEHWETEVNKWLNDLAMLIPCYPYEQLEKCGDDTRRFKSRHLRIDHRSQKTMSDINILHFWLDLRKPSQ